MPYISSSGNLGESREWSLSRIPDLFWGFINFIVLFFQTLVNPNLTKRGNSYTSDYRPGSGPPPGPPSRRLGGLRRMGGPGPPPMGGG
ncbi:selenoprotein K-like [Oratosquilla oratoria]|uniref:selenoprotein K-like n=1 Tax=Oratosquilla oratoria TaxID=337810 RepID=UPI003F775C23